MAQEFRVFVSSTFTDHQAERDHLVKNIFPRVRHVCRERGVEFTEIDLRWGVTEEDAVRGRVVRACLEEIDRCRPYFIGILGERYGWSPQLHEIQKDAELLRAYPWVEDAALEGQSIVEMEIAHGVLHGAGPQPGSIVLVRNAPDGSSAPADATRLAELRARITGAGVPFTEYATPEELGQAVLRHLLTILDRDFPADAAGSELRDVQRGHATYASSRRQAYIADPSLLAQLTAHARGKGVPLVITAPSGYGKSALLAYWSDWYRRKYPGAFVVSHFVGAGVAGDDRYGLVRHCILEIKERMGIADAVPGAQEDLDAQFPLWLARAGPQPMVLVVDAIDELGAGSALAWLPRFIPSHVRLVVSVNPGAIEKYLTGLGWRHLELEPLDEQRREALIVRFLGEYQKALSIDQNKRIAGDPKSSMPLFLRTLLEELRLSGSFELLDERIGHYLASRDCADLFHRVLVRLEEDHGVTTVRPVFSALWAARKGLKEHEIVAATGVDAATVGLLLRALDYHLVQRDGMHMFFHSYLRDAVAARYLPDEASRQAQHAKLGGYLAGQPLDARRAAEEPWQWLQAADMGRLRDCITPIPMFALLYSPSRVHELLKYWHAVGAQGDLVDAYRAALDAFAAQEPHSVAYARAWRDVGAFFVAASRFDAAESILRTAVALHTELFGGHDLRTAACHDEIGAVLYYKGAYAEAEATWRSVLATREALLGAGDGALCESLDNLTAACYAQGRFAEGEAFCRRSLEISKEVYGPGDLQTSARLNNLASVLTDTDRLDEALATMDRAVAIKRAVLGEDHPEVGRSLVNLGIIYEKLQHEQSAAKQFRAALAILESTVGTDHDAVISALSSLASVLTTMGEFEQAHACFDRVLPIAHRVLGEQHVRTVHIYCLLAQLLADEGRSAEAIDLFRRWLPVHGQMLGMHPRHIRNVHRFVELLRTTGLNEEAGEWERRIGA